MIKGIIFVLCNMAAIALALFLENYRDEGMSVKDFLFCIFVGFIVPASVMLF